MSRCCAVCGKALTRRQKVTCSRACRDKRNARERVGRSSPKKQFVTIVCAVCGATVCKPAKALSYGRTRTCSPACAQQFRAQYGRIVGNAPKTPQATAKRLLHDSCRSCPDQASAKHYSLLSPDGKRFAGRNLTYFVKQHFRVSGRDAEKIANALSKLRPWVSNRRKSWHGWRWAE